MTPVFFQPFHNLDVYGADVPDIFTLMAACEPHPLCLKAASELQQYLSTQHEWEHNFGITNERSGPVIGKMFGVLVVQTTTGEIGYLCAFSGKLAGTNQHPMFVPPIYDALAENGFLTAGMMELTRFTTKLETLLTEKPEGYEVDAARVMTQRKQHSKNLQQRLFANYACINERGESKTVLDIFESFHYKNPPAGAAECATPKLLQYAFLNELKPIAVAEFWWGLSPKSERWKHRVFYPCCKEKCEPILAHMLSATAHQYS